MNNNEMPISYNFTDSEQRIYSWWEENGWFKPEARPESAKPFVISIPPPNITGELHQGHALFVAVEDLMIRHARMKGLAALWVPGTDHAGIATQLQIEKQLKSEGLTREEIGREAFVNKTWEWKEKYGSYITKQLRRLGASCDWDRERFTLDEGLSAAVREAFVRLYRMVLIYRGEYLVNWSPGLQTAVSDLEVEYSEEEGLLYYFNYPVSGGGRVPVATTRPETILGDTALAVHPEDDRYSEYVGKTALVPILNREIPIIADEYVDKEFGTGALKVTPGHDPDDFEIGRRHNLDIVNVINKDGTMSDAAGKYRNLDRFDCREVLWADMAEEGLTIRSEPYMINIPRSQRGGEIIEPLVSRQWFVNAEPMARLALTAVSSGRIRIVPGRFEKVWRNWLENIQPWCISRQLWWGHRIPVWYCNDCDQLTVATKDPDICQNCGSDDIFQDPDVLDTWFSSGLWPFSTLGWPEETADLERFYPTDVLETGYDILFFWVARMVMAGAMFTNDLPFHTVYLHGLVRDEQGRKMSKSIGNVVDPLDVMQESGADALRFTLLTGGTPGNDLNLALSKVTGSRNFVNKIWNIARYIVRSIKSYRQEAKSTNENILNLSMADKWILTKHNVLVESTSRLFDNYQYGEAGRQIHEFLWFDFADWYIELSKVQIDRGTVSGVATLTTLVHVFDNCLRLLHPFIPFLTEEIWQHLRSACLSSTVSQLSELEWPEALIIADWPESSEKFEGETADFDRIRELIRAIRAVRADYKVEPKRFIPAQIAAGKLVSKIEAQRSIIVFLARLDDEHVVIKPELDPPPTSATITKGEVSVYLPLTEMIDLTQERTRLRSEIEDLGDQITRLSTLLGSEFSNRAPEAVVQKERDKLTQYKASRAQLIERLSGLE